MLQRGFKNYNTQKREIHSAERATQLQSSLAQDRMDKLIGMKNNRGDKFQENSTQKLKEIRDKMK